MDNKITQKQVDQLKNEYYFDDEKRVEISEVIRQGRWLIREYEVWLSDGFLDERYETFIKDKKLTMLIRGKKVDVYVEDIINTVKGDIKQLDKERDISKLRLLMPSGLINPPDISKVYERHDDDKKRKQHLDGLLLFVKYWSVINKALLNYFRTLKGWE